MAREKELYRDNLDRLDKAYPQRECLRINDIAIYLGCSYQTAYRRFKKYNKRGGVSKCIVARELS